MTKEFEDLLEQYSKMYLELEQVPKKEKYDLKEYIKNHVSKSEKACYEQEIDKATKSCKDSIRDIKEKEKKKNKEQIEKEKKQKKEQAKEEKERERLERQKAKEEARHLKEVEQSEKKQFKEDRKNEYLNLMEAMDSQGKGWVKTLDVDKSYRFKDTASNYKTILSNEYEGKWLYIEEAKRRLFDGFIFDDSTKSYIRVYIEEMFGIYNKNKFNDAINVVFKNNSICMQEKLFSRFQPENDDTDYLEYLISAYEWNLPTTEVLSIFKKFLSNVYCTLTEPGRRNRDIMLVIKGEQGCGKSSLCKLLGMVDWQNDGHSFLSKYYSSYNVISDMYNMKNAEFIYENSRALITEWAEFQGGSRTEVTKIKAMTSQRSADKRRAYKEEEEIYNWNGVLIITTNENNFLKDTTGNRRFCIVECKGLKYPERLDELCENEGEKLFWMWGAYGKWIEECKKTKQFKEFCFTNDDVTIYEKWNEKEMYYMQEENIDKIIEYVSQRFPNNWDNLSKIQQKSFFKGASEGSFLEFRNKFCLEELIEFGLDLSVTATTKKTTKKLIESIDDFEYIDQPNLTYRGVKKRYYIYKKEHTVVEEQTDDYFDEIFKN